MGANVLSTVTSFETCEFKFISEKLKWTQADTPMPRNPIKIIIGL